MSAMARRRGFPPEVRDLVLRRAGGSCERCGIPSYRYEFHHRRPRGMGGSRNSATNRASNCILLCPSCHRSVESKRELAVEYGYLVPQSQVPATVPVWVRWGWVLFDDDGGATKVAT